MVASHWQGLVEAAELVICCYPDWGEGRGLRLPLNCTSVACFMGYLHSCWNWDGVYNRQAVLIGQYLLQTWQQRSYYCTKWSFCTSAGMQWQLGCLL